LEEGAAAGAVLGFESAPVDLNETLADGKTQSGPRGPSLLRTPIELFEEPGKIGLRQARAPVRDLYLQDTILGLGGYLHRGILRGLFEGVVHQVHQDLFDQKAV